jgi:hypothetical protein
MIEIQNNIPVPAIIRTRDSKYPWHSMQVGDSFFVADFTVKQLAGTAYAAAKRHSTKYTIRSIDGGVRVWRTA